MAEDESKIPLHQLFTAINKKDRKWWDTLTEKQQEKFSTWLYNRYLSVAKSNNADMQRYYTMATNEVANVDSGALTKNHKQLQYLLLTTIPNEYAITDHFFISGLKRKVREDKKKKTKLLEQLYPEMKYSDIDTLAQTISDEELIEYLRDMAWSEKEIAKALAD